MDAIELNQLYQQMGELLGSVRALHEKVDLRHAQAEMRAETLTAEMREVKRDHRDLDQRLNISVASILEDIDFAKVSASVTNRAISELTGTVESLAGPVEEIITLRSRAMGVFLAMGAIGSVTLYLITPIYRWFVQSVFGVTN